LASLPPATFCIAPAHTCGTVLRFEPTCTGTGRSPGFFHHHKALCFCGLRGGRGLQVGSTLSWQSPGLRRPQPNPRLSPKHMVASPSLQCAGGLRCRWWFSSA
jgi:hypothetical protein